MRSLPPEPATLYLDLLARVLTRFDLECGHREFRTSPESYDAYLLELLMASAGRRDLALVEPAPFDPAARREGRDWPPTAETMVGLARLENVRACVDRVIADDVPGDLMETGVWRGGAAIMMRAVLAARGVADRRVWCADSFTGLPPPDEGRFPQDKDDRHHTRPQLAVSLAEVRSNFASYGLLDDRVQFLEGWFEDTLPTAPVERLAVLRLDGDMYGSTITALDALYSTLSPGGYLIVDDYGAIPSCRAAVEDFREREHIGDPIEKVDWTGVFWRKTATATQ